jgi:hypothetical protein
METSADDATIGQLFASFRDSGFHFRDLLIGLIRTPQFWDGLDLKPERANLNMVPVSPKAVNAKPSSLNIEARR